MRDLDIRRALKQDLLKKHFREKGTRILDELGVCQGQTRVDIAVINGYLNGYEIKSERDTLQRLPRQMELYNQVFDYITIVSSKKHADNIKEIIPKWWGIRIAYDENNKVSFYNQREPQLNQVINLHALVQLLWRDEALKVLNKLNIIKGCKSKPRAVLWARLADNTTRSELGEIVRTKLKARLNWRSHQLQI